MGEVFEQQPLKQFTEKAYLDYSMYVILDRALPHLGDGLKPVQRRIIYAMSELGLSAGAKPKKSARTVGDVLGKFHPHGDVACYEAMVQMAQPFSYRYPLIDGQGNWGSPDDPKSFAAMRYTEARLATHAQLLLEELGQGTVDWVPNFDGTLEEPALLPARLPHVLLNGANGIAVGMATDIPPHNLREVAAACIHLLENPKATVEDLCRHVQGPDLPTEAEIVTPPEDLVAMYRNGTGSVRMRARYVREGQAVVVTALPYQVSGSRVLGQIAQQMQARKLPMVEDLRDESDHEQPTRLVIVPRSGRVDVDALMDHLFATTDLEHSIRVNLNVIGLDGRPQVMDLRVLIKEWLQFRTATVRRRLEYRLDQVRRRLHVLEGLLAAYLNLDEVIAIIRNDDEPRPALMERFDLSELQANAILDMRLRHLARLEEMRIRGEQEELDRERGGLEKTLSSARRLKTVVRHELEGDAERYGDERRSPLAVRQPARAFRETELLPSEPVTVVLSRKGWVRAAKGHDLDPARLSFRSGDGFQAAAHGRSNGTAVFLDTGGRSYAIPVHGLPSARSLGEPLTGRVDAPDGAGFVGVMMGEGEDRWLLATDAGYGFIATLEALTARNRGGKAVVTVPQGSHVLPPARVADPRHARVAVLSTAGRLLLFPAAELPEMPRGRGVRLMHIPPAKRRSGDERVLAALALEAGAALRVDCGRRHLSLKGGELDAYLGGRGTRGQLLPRGLRRVQGLMAGD